jgi:hypothetical protein
MSKNGWRFNQTEIKRAIKSVEACGLKVKQIEIAPDGNIKVSVASPETALPDDPESLRRLL